MNYDVTWNPIADRQLVEIWTTAVDRKAVTRAADFIDAELQSDPYALSESRSGDERIMIIPPLTIRFTVHEAGREVVVWSVWHRGRPPS